MIWYQDNGGEFDLCAGRGSVRVDKTQAAFYRDLRLKVLARP